MARAKSTAFLTTAWLLGFSAFSGGCRVDTPGLPDHGGLGDAPSTTDGAAPDRQDSRPGDPRPADAPRSELVEPDASVVGSAGVVGCADGSREGFPDLADWPDIAGCSGAWSLPGLLDERALHPQCGRGGGNDGLHKDGLGCSVTDLCAQGWHVCRGSHEVAARSQTGCENAVSPPATRFFLVAAGASLQGVCYPDRAAVNDLHGCGTLGQSHTPACDPLDRRMGFADCATTAGIWSCGSVDEFDREATVVTKNDGALGGALCCRD